MDTKNWPRAVIFDMDGLMFQTEQQIIRAWDEVGPEIVGEPMGYNIYQTMGMNRAMRVDYFYQHYGPDFPYETFEQKYKAKVSSIKEKEGIPVQKGLFGLLDYLTETGLPFMLATGSSRQHTLENLQITGTAKYFDPKWVLAGDQVEKAKPDPYIYLKSCEMLGIQPEEALVLEDSWNGVRAAYAAGTPVILIPDLQKDSTPVDDMYFKKMESLDDVTSYIRSLQDGEK